jgi:hypothetical protein
MSTVNFPMMEGLLLKLHINLSFKPVQCHVLIPVPLHWWEQVKADLDRDVQLGVIEKVPEGTPDTWLSRMVIVAKKDRKLRRTMDYQELNKAATRETNPNESPFNLCCQVPHHKLKTICDAWNGYHSVAIRKEGRHFTSFVTPWGSYRYLVAPQGYVASGDGYTRCSEAITKEYKNKVCMVDNTLLYHDDLDSAFTKTCKYLDTCAKNGIVLNPDKFHFAKEVVEFAGFEITMEAVRPSEKHLQEIWDFPAPMCLKEVRSWFGLVNQVAFAFSASSMMEPFRHLLKPKLKFAWSPQLQVTFEESRWVIVEMVTEGVKIFDMKRVTCLLTDWSKMGLGFFLVQNIVLVSRTYPSAAQMDGNSSSPVATSHTQLSPDTCP